MYPIKMEANNHIYNINSDYRVALACFRALKDNKLTSLERFYAVETLLLGEDVLEEDEEIIAKKIAIYLRCGSEENVDTNEIDYDYIQDEVLTKTSIRQCYNNLDISKLEYLHWYEYNELISGLTNESIINRIRDIRNIDLREISDERQREKILKAKDRVEIKNEEAEEKTKEYDEIDKFWDELIGGVKHGSRKGNN